MHPDPSEIGKFKCAVSGRSALKLLASDEKIVGNIAIDLRSFTQHGVPVKNGGAFRTHPLC